MSTAVSLKMEIFFLLVIPYIMRLNISDVKELVHLGQDLWRLGREKIGVIFQRKPHVSRIPPCRGYFPREEDAEIRDKLNLLTKLGRSFSGVKTLILHGPQGCGKKFSAANLMNKLHTSPVKGSFISDDKRNFLLEKPTITWTLNATNTRTLLESYCSLAKEIGLTKEAEIAQWELPLHNRTSEGRQYQMYLRDYCQTDAYNEALKQIYEEVMKKLRVQNSWVLLVDGFTADNVGGLDRYWPQPGDCRFGNGLVIMTTESPELLVKDVCDSSLEKVHIGKMTESDAVKFLESKSGVSATGNDKMNAEDKAVNM